MFSKFAATHCETLPGKVKLQQKKFLKVFSIGGPNKDRVGGEGNSLACEITVLCKLLYSVSCLSYVEK